ncbi:MAG: PEP-CTERM sorting domain-containing protein [Armatimonadota bacterium]|nr:PEP-CTERM sorting domain-containing protein [Armatimonadota bacterium]
MVRALRAVFIVFLALLFCPVAVMGANQIGWSYSLTDLGGGQYNYEFNFDNLGIAKDAVFKIHINGTSVPKQWSTVSWNTPFGWNDKREDSFLEWWTGNGDIINDGYYRLFGQPGAPIPPTMGWTSQTFGWTFNKNTGPTPTANYFNASDVVVHVQQIDDYWHNYGSSYEVDPVTVPEPSSLIALFCGISGMAFGRRRSLWR